MAQLYSNILFHITFRAKNRRPVITDDLTPRLYEYVGGIIRSEKGTLLDVGGTHDHVHLLLRWRYDKDVAPLVRAVKSKSSKWVHDAFLGHGEFRWQAGYGVFSVSHSQVDRVRAYIQKQHHKRASFKEEFVALLKAHGIEYDERYLWD